MSNISIPEIEKVAGLAKLEFSDAEIEKFTGQFEKIIDFVEIISRLDTSGMKPMTHAVEKINVFREDVVENSMEIEEIEKIAPEFSERSFIVPRIIDAG